jgi:hypothetical protein
MKDKLNQFVANLNGQFVEVSYKEAIYQCMDLAYTWVFCLGFPKATIQHTYAYEVFTSPNQVTLEHFEIIPNSPTAIPQDGDLVIWSNKYGPAGHIAVALGGGTTSKFTCFEQNNPLGTNAHLQERSYSYVLGWLRPKVADVTDPDKIKIDLGDPWGILETQAIKSKLSDLARDIKNEQDKFNGFVQKWIQEWNLPTGSSMVYVEVEMARLLPLEDSMQKFRDSIEEVVGAFDSDIALLTSLQGVRSEIKSKNDQIVDLQNKLDAARIPAGYKFLKSWTIMTLLWKLYKRET